MDPSINYISGPAGMPRPIVESAQREINADPAASRDRRAQELTGVTPIIERQPALVKRIADESEKWKKVIALIK